MRVLILGGDGMLGHQLLARLQAAHDVRVTLRGEAADYASLGALHEASGEFGVDVRDEDRLREVLTRFRPAAVVNAVGIVRQREEARDAETMIAVNALFPHRLSRLAGEIGARIIHIGTDCVFSGRRGSYRESDVPDAEDLYGRSKLLGELVGPARLTLRSSIIGPELRHRQGLVEWFLASPGRVRGYRRVIFSGLTTLELARVVERVLLRHPALEGLYHVASRPIDKHTLLVGFARHLGRDEALVEPADQPVSDHSLDGRAFAEATGYHAPSWDDMLAELAEAVRHRRP